MPPSQVHVPIAQVVSERRERSPSVLLARRGQVGADRAHVLEERRAGGRLGLVAADVVDQIVERHGAGKARQPHLGQVRSPVQLQIDTARLQTAEIDVRRQHEMPVPGDRVAVDELAVATRVVERIGRIADPIGVEALRVGRHGIERSDDALDLDSIPVDGDREVAQSSCKGRAQHRAGRQGPRNLGLQFGIAAERRNLVRQEAGRAVGVRVLVENRRPGADDRGAQCLYLRPVRVRGDVSPRRLSGDRARVRWCERHYVECGA